MEYTIDAEGKRLGRLASTIAGILQGKKSAKYDPKDVGSDRVLLTNYRKFSVGGNKMIQKIYYRHTGYMGHLREKKLEEVFAKDPKKVVREAVRRMLPKNFLNQKRMKNLIFVEND